MDYGWGFGRSLSQCALPFGSQAAKSLSDLCIPSFDQVMVSFFIFDLETKNVFVLMDLFLLLGWFFSFQRCIARSETGCSGAVINSD